MLNISCDSHVSIHIGSVSILWTWPCLVIQSTHTNKKKESERVFFVTLFHRKGERFNQSVIAFTKQDVSVSHFPGARNVTSSCKIKMNGVSYFIRITSTELSLYCEGCWVATQGPNNVAAFGNHRCWGRSTKIILFIQGCWVPKSTHCKLWAFSPSCFSSADASILLT